MSEVDDRVDHSPSTAYRRAVAALNPQRLSATTIAAQSLKFEKQDQVTRPTVSKVLRGDYTSWKKAQNVIRVLGHDPRDYEGYWAAAYGTHPSTEVIDLRNASDELERQLRAANQQYSDQVRELEATLQQVRDQATIGNAELDQAKANWEQAQADLEQATAELERLGDTLSETHENHAEEIAAAQQTANVLETALQQRQQALKARDNRIKELEKDVEKAAASAQSTGDADKSRAEELRVALAEERDQARRNTQTHEEELTKLRSSLTAENKRVGQKLEELRGSLNEAQTELRKVRNAAADAERRNEEAARTAKQDAAQFNETVKNLRADLERGKEAVTEKDLQIIELNERLAHQEQKLKSPAKLFYWRADWWKVALIAFAALLTFIFFTPELQGTLSFASSNATEPVNAFRDVGSSEIKTTDPSIGYPSLYWTLNTGYVRADLGRKLDNNWVRMYYFTGTLSLETTCPNMSVDWQLINPGGTGAGAGTLNNFVSSATLDYDHSVFLPNAGDDFVTLYVTQENASQSCNGVLKLTGPKIGSKSTA